MSTYCHLFVDNCNIFAGRLNKLTTRRFYGLIVASLIVCRKTERIRQLVGC